MRIRPLHDIRLKLVLLLGVVALVVRGVRGLPRPLALEVVRNGVVHLSDFFKELEGVFEDLRREAKIAYHTKTYACSQCPFIRSLRFSIRQRFFSIRQRLFFDPF